MPYKREAQIFFPHDSRLSGYWSFDEESGNSISSYKGSGITLPFDLSDANRSHWGVKGRAVALTGTDNVTTGNVGSTGSFSMWVKPEGNFTFYWTIAMFPTITQLAPVLSMTQSQLPGKPLHMNGCILRCRRYQHHTLC